MKNAFSFFTVIAISCILLLTRLYYTDWKAPMPLKLTTWDALGYYLYLPAKDIYHDQTTNKWLDSLDKTYQLSGGELYQLSPLPNGHYVGKYLRGVSILQYPFFKLADWYARHQNKYPADGFSPPYQFALAYGLILYIILSLFLLRKILLYYFSDTVVSWTLLVLLIGTNAIQYIAVEAGQSHGYIFPLYVFIIYLSIRWHRKATLILGFLLGIVFGLACISRPTEAVMLFIPILWDLNDRASWKAKWELLKSQPLHLILPILGCCLAISPQLIYWKTVTGHWVYDVGSKWDFLNPHWRVLFGPEKGWFVYTPLTLLFVYGLFRLKAFSFRSAIVTFCVLNIYIIIAWHTWRYGGSYSTRALVQSYPVFAIPLAAGLQTLLTRFRYLIPGMLVCFIGINLFQIWQYNQTILHYDGMNWNYYRSIFLNPSPTPQAYSLMDDGEPKPELTELNKYVLLQDSLPQFIPDGELFNIEFSVRRKGSFWVHGRVDLLHQEGLWDQYLWLELLAGKERRKIRLFRPQAKERNWNTYEAWFTFTASSEIQQLRWYSTSFPCEARNLKVVLYSKE